MDSSRDSLQGLMGMAGMMDHDDNGTGGGNATPEEIKALGDRYLEKHEFELGQLVTWKDGMDNCKYPAPGKPAVVIDKENGLRSGKGRDEHLGGNHDYAPHSIRIGILQGEQFECYWVDGNRFQPFQQ